MLMALCKIGICLMENKSLVVAIPSDYILPQSLNSVSSTGSISYSSGFIVSDITSASRLLFSCADFSGFSISISSPSKSIANV